MIRSFRLRLALLSALTTALVLGAFGAATYWLIREQRVERLTQQVREEAEREAGKVRSSEDWRRIEGKIAASLGVVEADDLLLLVARTNGDVAYRSEHWPARLDESELRWPMLGQDSPGVQVQQVEQGEVGRAAAMRRPPPLSAMVPAGFEGKDWRFGLAIRGQDRVAVGVDLAMLDASLNEIRNGILLALPLALLLTGSAAWLFSARAIRPVHKLVDAAHRISAERLDQRIPLHGEDREFADMIAMFNAMLARLERSFHQARRFSADAAHELKTPLAILQGQLERAIGTVEPGSPMQSELSSILDEVRRLSSISRKLLLLSQADAGRLSLHLEPYDLSSELAALVDDLQLLAPDLSVTALIEPGLAVEVDVSLFPQILHNLLSNAIKYNVAKGWVAVNAGRQAGGVVVHIANRSHGLPAASRERLFERFYRVDPAHNRRIDGSGLGLCVSREIARAHGGDIEFALVSADTVEVTLFLPHRGRTA